MATESTAEFDAKGDKKVRCLECSSPSYYHRLDVHLSTKHGMSVASYTSKHPGADTISEAAKAAASKGQVKSVAAATAKIKAVEVEDAPLHIGVARVKLTKSVSEADRVFIPNHDENWKIGTREKAYLEALALGIEEREHVALVGPTGSGKSAMTLELGSIVGQPVRRMNLTGDSRVQDFLGEKVVDVDPTSGQAVVVWRDGILPQAMRRGHWLLLDEVDAAPPAILFALQAVLEKDGKLVLPGNGGEVVKPHPNFRVIATANTKGRGDDSGLYAGTNILNEAFWDRFGIVIEMDYADEATEIDIVTAKTGLDPKIVAKMVRVARTVRESHAKEEAFCTFSTRRLIAWASKTVRYGDPLKAAKYTVISKLSGDDAKTVHGIIQRYFGGAVS
jgi:cobaltochelatase CobS